MGRGVGRRLLAILAALGVLSTVGSYLVGRALTRAEEVFEPPAIVSVREDPQGGSDGFNVATRAATSLEAQLPGVNGSDDLLDAAKDAGAVDIGVVREAVVLEGGTRRDISIVGMRARVLRREPALAGALIMSASAGAEEAIGIVFDLDDEDPIAREVPEDGLMQDGAPYFGEGNIIRLAKGEIQPLALIGLSTWDYVEWEVEADCVIDGETKTFLINADGEAFRVTGEAPEDVGYKRYYEWRWYVEPARMWVSDHPSTP